MTKKVRSILLVLLAGMFMAGVNAAAEAKKGKKPDPIFGTDLPIMANNMIEVKSYDPKTKTYEVFATNFPGEEETLVTPESLGKSIKTIKLSRIKRFPEEIVGQQFKTDRDLPGLTDEELKLRAKK